MNLVILKGNLTREPELKFLQSGTAVLNCGMAINERYTDQQGQQQENVTFVEIEAWQRTAEIINEYFDKGSEILIQGSLKFEQWEAEDGTNRNRLRVRVQRFEFCGANPNGNGNGNQQGQGQGNQQGNQRNQGTQQRETPQNAPPAPTASADDGAPGDDIPF